MINDAVRQEVQMQMSAKSTGIWNSIQKQVKRGVIAQAMFEHKNNQSNVAQALGINRASLRKYIGQVFTKSECKEMGVKS